MEIRTPPSASVPSAATFFLGSMVAVGCWWRGIKSLESSVA
jgi:hypothetical protein